MYVLSDTSECVNHIFKTFDELYDWVHAKQTKSSIIQSIATLIEKEVARRVGTAVPQPQSSTVLNKFSNPKEECTPLYLDRPLLAGVISEVIKFKLEPIPEFNNIFFPKIAPEETDTPTCIDTPPTCIDTSLIQNYFNTNLCISKSVEYTVYDIYIDNSIIKYSIYLWVEFADYFNLDPVPIEVSESIYTFMKEFSPDKIDSYNLFILPNKTPIKHKFFNDLYYVYMVLTKLASRKNTRTAQLAYEFVRNEYRSTFTHKNPTKEELQILLKKWIVYYVMYCVKDSEIQSSKLFLDINNALGKISPIIKCGNDNYCSILQGALNTKVIAQVLLELGVISIRKSSGKFYDLSQFMTSHDINPLNKCDIDFTLTDYATVL